MQPDEAWALLGAGHIPDVAAQMSLTIENACRAITGGFEQEMRAALFEMLCEGNPQYTEHQHRQYVDAIYALAHSRSRMS